MLDDWWFKFGFDHLIFELLNFTNLVKLKNLVNLTIRLTKLTEPKNASITSTIEFIKEKPDMIMK